MTARVGISDAKVMLTTHLNDTAISGLWHNHEEPGPWGYVVRVCCNICLWLSGYSPRAPAERPECFLIAGLDHAFCGFRFTVAELKEHLQGPINVVL